MARGRMVNKKISNSKRVNELPVPAALLYTWLIPHLDVNGVFYGDAKMVKSLVFPRQNCSIKQVENWLTLMEKTLDEDGEPLIFRFVSGGDTYLCMPGFVGEQVGLRRDKELTDFPDPLKFRTFDGKNPENSGKNTETFRTNDGKNPENSGKNTETFRTNDGKNPEKCRPKGKGREVNISEVEEKRREGEENITEPSSSSDNIFTLYHDNIQPLTDLIKNTLIDAEEHYGADEVREAIKIAVLANKKNWPYIEGILRNKKDDRYSAPVTMRIDPNPDKYKLPEGFVAYGMTIEDAKEIVAGRKQATVVNQRIAREGLDRLGNKV